MSSTTQAVLKANIADSLDAKLRQAAVEFYDAERLCAEECDVAAQELLAVARVVGSNAAYERWTDPGEYDDGQREAVQRAIESVAECERLGVRLSLEREFKEGVGELGVLYVGEADPDPDPEDGCGWEPARGYGCTVAPPF